MIADKGRVSNLDYCVAQVMADRGENDTAIYEKYLSFANKAFRKMNLYTLPTIKTETLVVDELNRAWLPDDYVNYLAIGVIVGDHIVTLTLDSKLKFNLGDCKPDAMTDIVQQVGTNPNALGIYGYGYYFGQMWRDGQFVGEMYGIGGGYNSNGYYRLNEGEGFIQLGSVVAGQEIVLEYKATGYGCDGNVSIPYGAIDAIVSFIHWQIVEFDRAEPMNNKIRKKQLHDQDYIAARAFFNRTHISEFLDAKYRTGKQTPKR